MPGIPERASDRGPGAGRWRAAVLPVAGLALLVAMGLDTRVVRIGSKADTRSGAFQPAAYGTAEFPKVRDFVQAHATDAATLAAALAQDADAAAKRYGVAADAGPEFAVRFTGKAGEQDSGAYAVDVPGVSPGIKITVQTGPAIIGTDLRDATGAISFGQFSNQIEYQNAGSALNAAMKRAALAGLDVAHLTGRTVAVTGVFQLTDPGSWAVTPVRLEVR